MVALPQLVSRRVDLADVRVTLKFSRLCVYSGFANLTGDEARRYHQYRYPPYPFCHVQFRISRAKLAARLRQQETIYLGSRLQGANERVVARGGVPLSFHNWFDNSNP
jgi:hypothetical protein